MRNWCQTQARRRRISAISPDIRLPIRLQTNARSPSATSNMVGRSRSSARVGNSRATRSRSKVASNPAASTRCATAQIRFPSLASASQRCAMAPVGSSTRPTRRFIRRARSLSARRNADGSCVHSCTVVSTKMSGGAQFSTQSGRTSPALLISASTSAVPRRLPSARSSPPLLLTPSTRCSRNSVNLPCVRRFFLPTPRANTGAAAEARRSCM